MTSAATAQEITFPAADGYPLAGRLWQGSPGRSIALINAGAGITSVYYDRFAAFLAASGITTLVYDYRGIGRSRRGPLKGFVASVEDWGSKDCAGALEWLARTFPDRARIVVGHSIGGFITGLAPNGDLIDRLLLVSAHTGFWGDYAYPQRPWMYLLWHVFMPAVTSLVGYFPGRALRLGDDLPAGVAKEWAARKRGDVWSNVRRPDGQIDEGRRKVLLSRFHQVRARTLAIRFSDDPFATRAATERVLSLYANARATSVQFSPSDIATTNIGHFGFFRSRMRQTLWSQVLSWLNEPDIEIDGASGARAAD